MSEIDHTIEVHVPDNISNKRLSRIEERYNSLGLSFVIVKVPQKYFGAEVKGIIYDEFSEPLDEKTK